MLAYTASTLTRTDRSGDIVDLSLFRHDLNRGRGRGVEIAWWFCKILFFQCDWPLPNSFRRAILVAFGASIGKGLVMRPGVNIHFPWKLEVGRNVWIGERSTILNLEPIKIASNVAIAHEVYITSGGHDITDPTFSYRNRPVVIQEGAWLASRSFIGPGVTVGAGSVVAAGAVVTSDVTDFTVVGGVPAKVIGQRTLRGL